MNDPKQSTFERRVVQHLSEIAKAAKTIRIMAIVWIVLSALTMLFVVVAAWISALR